METHERLEAWVNGRMAATEPGVGWPDMAAGRRQVDPRLRKQTSRLWLWAGAAAAACVTVLALPPVRAVAQRLWDEVMLGRVQVVPMDYDGADGLAGTAGFVSPEIYKRPDVFTVASLAEAVQRAGFSPRLPMGGPLQGPPGYSVTDEGAARMPLHAPVIRNLLVRTGGSPDDVPQSWDGVTLELRAGPIVIADYAGVLLLQSEPFALLKPADFDVERFYRVAFQALGMSEAEAQALSVDLALSPALLTFMPKGEEDLVHRFRTNSGTGIMIHDVYGPGKIVGVWSGPDRIYALYPSMQNVSREFILQVARSLE